MNLEVSRKWMNNFVSPNTGRMTTRADAIWRYVQLKNALTSPALYRYSVESGRGWLFVALMLILYQGAFDRSPCFSFTVVCIFPDGFFCRELGSRGPQAGKYFKSAHAAVPKRYAEPDLLAPY